MKKQFILLGIVLASFLGTNKTEAQVGDEYLGGISMFAGTFAPRGWAFCHGQLLSISQNQALFSLLGTIYGGDGRTTFALPDLRGRVAIGAGQGPGLSNRTLGQKFGTETATLSTAELPSHSHAVDPNSTIKIAVNTSAGEEADGNGKHIASQLNAFNTTPTNSKTLAGTSITTTVHNSGGGQSHTNIQPSLAINYIICIQGQFPSRN
ncbi:MAG: tail fiber protein [Algibacter sp.]|uniref:phage tail protein n=1 Tax=Algibacter sp. TaxID=1872428 RepID=UPI003296869B